MTVQTTRARRATIIAAAALAFAPGLVFAAAAESGPLATIHAFLADFNKGDVPAAQATNTDDVTILDEIPPHAWHGPGAFQTWLGDLTKDATAKGQTDTKVQVVRTVRSQVEGDAAYAVVKVNLLYREHGHKMIEPAQFAFSLHQDAGAWKINSWAWTGGVAEAAAAKPKVAAPAPAKPAT